MNQHDTHDKTAPSSAWSNDMLWALSVTDNPVMLVDCARRVTLANAATRALAERVRPGADPEFLLTLLPDDAWTLACSGGGWHGEITCASGMVLSIALHCDEQAGTMRSFLTFDDLSARNGRERELQLRHDELQNTYRRLAGTQEQLLQSEKMASIGQLAAGVAHEINNPIGYVHSNLGTLQEYIGALFALVEAHEAALQASDPVACREEVRAKRDRLDIDFIIGDLPKLLAESREGIERVTKIVHDLKDFSHTGRDEAMRPSDLHRGLESTLNIVWNDLKYKVRLEKHYGELPLVECHQSEINQVLMNLLINAGQSITERGSIVIATGAENNEAWISIADSGCGIAADALQRIFEPFYTTKPIGRGTGLGLAIAYSIIAKHHGRIEVTSKPGAGSAFRVVLPTVQPRDANAA
ncbi:MAG TPA: ATP-binding protein [Lysobacter sp.]